MSHTSVLIFTAIGGEGSAEAFDVLAGVGELGARSGQDEEGDHPEALQGELHDCLWERCRVKLEIELICVDDENWALGGVASYLYCLFERTATPSCIVSQCPELNTDARIVESKSSCFSLLKPKLDIRGLESSSGHLRSQCIGCRQVT